MLLLLKLETQLSSQVSKLRSLGHRLQLYFTFPLKNGQQALNQTHAQFYMILGPVHTTATDISADRPTM